MRRLLTNWRILGDGAGRAADSWRGAVARVGGSRRHPSRSAVPCRSPSTRRDETRVRERFVVSAPVAGRLQRIELEPGDPGGARPDRARSAHPAQPTLLDARTQAELTAAVEAARAVVGQARAERAPRGAALGARASARCAGKGTGRRRRHLARRPRSDRDRIANRRGGPQSRRLHRRAAPSTTSSRPRTPAAASGAAGASD